MAESPTPPDADRAGPPDAEGASATEPTQPTEPTPTAAPSPNSVWSPASATVGPAIAQPLPPAVAAAEAAARQAAAQMTARGRAWWGQLDPTGKRPTIIVAIVLVGLVIGSQFLNALVPIPRGGGGGQPGVGTPVDIGNGVRVTPPVGWVAVGSPQNLPGVKFQKGATFVEVGIASFTAAPKDLLVAYVNQLLSPSAQDAKVSAATTVVAGNGRPTARASYTASFKDFGTAVDGEISTQVTDAGIGIIVNGYAPQGQLSGSLDEVRAFVDTIEVR